MGDGSAQGSSMQQNPADDDGSLLDTAIEELWRGREETIRAATHTVVDQAINDISEQLRSEGISAHRSELAKAAVAAFRERQWIIRNSWDVVPFIPPLVEFVSTAVATGLLGNLAYDALKGAVLSSHGHSESATERLEEVVLFAVAEQCRRFQLNVDPGKLRVRKWQLVVVTK